MIESPAKQHDRSRDPVITSLANRTRRAVIETLDDRSSAVDVTELATLVTATLSGDAVVDVTREAFEPVYTDLVHKHLPALEDADLVTWDSENGVVQTTDHPAFADHRVAGMLSVHGEEWDDILRAVRSGRRRHVLVVLAEREHLDREALARRVLARERGESPSEVSEDAVEDVLVDLHHVHLPALDHAGLLEYDGSTAEYTGHPDLDPSWLDIEPDTWTDTESAELSEGHDIWTIEGRGSIVSRGQELFDQADDELFLMVTTDGLLEDECVRRLKDAVDRGVDVYLGSQTKEVRDFVRREVPEATIWEPQKDWLNLPPRYERLGRLAFADRKAIMLATLGEEGEDGVPRETAITGEGPNNSLVILMRQMLGSRLDHLDRQSEDFRSQIPL